MPSVFDWSKTIAALPGNPIPPEWIATGGKGVKVAFVDFGANLTLPSLQWLDQQGRKFFTSVPGFSPAKLTGQDNVLEDMTVPNNGHGTPFLSLLAGKTPTPAPTNKDLVTGIANAASYYIIKATDSSGRVSAVRDLLRALELAGNLGIEIFITVQSIDRSNPAENVKDDEIKRVFNLAGVKNMFIFAPLKNATDADDWTGIVGDNFPNLRPEVFNVAMLPGADVITAVPDVIKSFHIPFLLSPVKGQVLSKSGAAITLDPPPSKKVQFSNSAAVSIMGGIAVLALSAFKQQNNGALPTAAQFTQLLGSKCLPLANALSTFQPPAIFKNF